MRDPFKKAVAEARIWASLGTAYTKSERSRARRRFDYALSKITLKDGSTPTPLDRLHLHIATVELSWTKP